MCYKYRYYIQNTAFIVRDIGAFLETENVKYLFAFKWEWITRELRVNKQDIKIIFVDGDSMIPTLNPGDIMLIVKDHGKMIQDGISVIRFEGTLLVKRFQRLPGNILKIISDN